LQQHLLVYITWQFCYFFLCDVVILILAELNFVLIFAHKEVEVVASHLKRLGLICFVDSVLEKLWVKGSINRRHLFHFDFVGELR